MTSMSEYRDNYPRYYGRSPSPAFYSRQNQYDTYDDQDNELNYPVENIGYGYDSQDHVLESVRPRPQSTGGLPSTMRQTPSPLRWAMQDLMDSLDTMSPQIPFPPSPRDSYDDNTRYTEQTYDIMGYTPDGWKQPEPFDAENVQAHQADEVGAPYMYPGDVRPPPLLNYVDKTQSKLDTSQNYHQSPQRDNTDLDQRFAREGSPSRLSDRRPLSSHSVGKPPHTSLSFHPPMPPPHLHRQQETESITGHSAKHSIFSSTLSDYSTAASSLSTESAGSAGSFARKKYHQQRQEEKNNSGRTALSVLPKSTSNSVLKRRKSYGSSLKRTIGKLLSPSPTKPPPGTVTNHGDKIIEWQNVRRDVNRANTPSLQERAEHQERLEMSEGLQVIQPIKLLERIIEGDESASGSPILPDETFDISSISRTQSDC
jgi:hypothetical protein